MRRLTLLPVFLCLCSLAFAPAPLPRETPDQKRQRRLGAEQRRGTVARGRLTRERARPPAATGGPVGLRTQLTPQGWKQPVITDDGT